MSEISPSIWNQDKNGEWKLYFNNDLEINTVQNTNIEQIKVKKNCSSENNFILGTLVMTPKGIGRLIKINENIGIIKFNNDDINEEQIPLNKISNYVTCFIYDYSNNIDNIIRLKIKVNGKVEDIFDELEKIKKIDNNECSYSLIYQGMLLKKEYTLEQINILNKSKFLLIKANNIKYLVSRFTNISQFWFTYAIDGICFSPSQKIKLLGIGLFGSHENKIISAIIRILDGPSYSSPVIYEDNIEIPASLSKINAISQIMFIKPINCKKNQDYSVVLLTKTLTNCYFGNKGKNCIEGEKGVIFLFKKMQGRSSGSGVEAGNFPELYYNLY